MQVSCPTKIGLWPLVLGCRFSILLIYKVKLIEFEFLKNVKVFYEMIPAFV